MTNHWRQSDSVDPRAEASVRTAALGRAAWGAALLLAPGPVLRHVHGLTVDRRSTGVARVLGARHLAQAAVAWWAPVPLVSAIGVLADSAHALTALGLAVVDPHRRRAGALDAVIASGWAASGVRELRRIG